MGAGWAGSPKVQKITTDWGGLIRGYCVGVKGRWVTDLSPLCSISIALHAVSALLNFSKTKIQPVVLVVHLETSMALWVSQQPEAWTLGWTGTFPHLTMWLLQTVVGQSKNTSLFSIIFFIMMWKYGKKKEKEEILRTCKEMLSLNYKDSLKYLDYYRAWYKILSVFLM